MNSPNAGQPPLPEFPTWRKLKLGTYKNAKEIGKALWNGGFRVIDYDMRLILTKVPVAESETEIELVIVTPYLLGLKLEERGIPRSAIYRRAEECGLSLLPAEAGPQLRLQYNDQPVYEGLIIGMEPIAEENKNGMSQLLIFCVTHEEDHLYPEGDGLWLTTAIGSPHFPSYDPVASWVFSRKQK